MADIDRIGNHNPGSEPPSCISSLRDLRCISCNYCLYKLKPKPKQQNPHNCWVTQFIRTAFNFKDPLIYSHCPKCLYMYYYLLLITIMSQKWKILVFFLGQKSNNRRAWILSKWCSKAQPMCKYNCLILFVILQKNCLVHTIVLLILPYENHIVSSSFVFLWYVQYCIKYSIIMVSVVRCR